LQIGVSTAGLIQRLGLAKGDPNTSPIPEETHQIIHPMTLRRRGVELKLVIEGAAQRHAKLDPTLIKVIARAHAWVDHLTSGRLRSVKDLAENQGLTGSYVTRVMLLAFLAPDIVEAILQGKQPPHLTAQTLLRGIELPLSWLEQRARLGFPPR